MIRTGLGSTPISPPSTSSTPVPSPQAPVSCTTRPGTRSRPGTIWNNQWDWAVTAVQRVLDQLKVERTPQRYAALWNYLGYSIAEHLAQQSGDSTQRGTGARYYRELQRKAQTSSFLAHIA